MTILAALQTDSSVEQEKDVLGGSYLVDSGLNDCDIVLAYLNTSKSGAMALNVELKTESGVTVRDQFWMTSSTANGGKNFYEKDGKKHYLPGFTMANHLALLTVGEEIGNIQVEEKTIKLRDFTTKKDVPTAVQMFTPLLGKKITAGILKVIDDKRAKNAAGEYQPTGETRQLNEIDKFFRHRDGLTVAEILAETTEAQFKGQWAEKWTGKEVNRAKGMTAAQAGISSGMPDSAGAAAAGNTGGTKSLFS